jgi:TolB-like protein
MCVNFFDELRRRNVFKVGIAYVVMGWVILQVISAIAPLIDLPDWLGRTVLVLLAVGFPLALFFAWAFELTPDDVKRTEDVDQSHSLTSSTGHKLDFIIIGVLVLGVGFMFWDRRNMQPVDDVVIDIARTNASIAVLPFVNMSSDPEQTYFSDGISEEILNVLAQIPNLHVTSRSSAFQFRGDDIHIPTVAQQLGVAHVLEGSVRKSGTTVRITAQLIEAASDRHMWSATYDRELDDIFAIQDEISAAIVEALKEALGIEMVAPTTQGGTTNTEAHEEYLLARHLFETRTEENLIQAQSHFERAVELDPDYALAWAELGNAHRFLSSRLYGTRPPGEAIAAGQIATMRAVALSPDLPEVQASLAHHYYANEEPVMEEQILRRLIQDYPNYARAYFWLSLNLLRQGGNSELLGLGEAANRLDPLSLPINENLARVYLYLGRFEDAYAILNRMAKIDSTSFLVSNLRQDLHFFQWQYADTIMTETRNPFLRLLSLIAVGRGDENIDQLNSEIGMENSMWFRQDYDGFIVFVLENYELEGKNTVRGDAELYAGNYDLARTNFEANNVCADEGFLLFECIHLGFALRMLGDEGAANETFRIARDRIAGLRAAGIEFFDIFPLDIVEAELLHAEGRLAETIALYREVVDKGYYLFFAQTPDKIEMRALPTWERVEAGLAKIRDTQSARLAELEAAAAQNNVADTNEEGGE